MLRYTLRRLLMALPTLFAISFLIFVIIELPPGSMIDKVIADEEDRLTPNPEKIAAIVEAYHLDEPFVLQYAYWIGDLLQGNLRYSFSYDLPVATILADRLPMTFLVALVTLLLTYAISFPIAVYSAIRQYSLGDYCVTFLGFLGLATPNFLLALIMLYFANIWFGTSIGGLMDPIFVESAWTWAKVGSVLEHLWIPALIIGTAGTAAMIRRLRANLLDEISKAYVTTARAKGLSPLKTMLKYPLRLSLNPFIADIGMVLPQLVSGSVLVSIVLDLPTTGPVLLEALVSQDRYLAGSFLLFEAALIVIAVLLSDLALAALDPRIRLGQKAIR